jgi:putative membrane protein
LATQIEHARDMLSAIVSALHLLALALGLPAVYLRGRALRGPLDAAGLRRLFAADNVWGLAALLWIATGLARAFAGLEKGSAFYLGSPLFWAKLALFGAVFALEVGPMVTLLRWRRLRALGRMPETSPARALYVLTRIELVLVVAIVFVAAFMVRGFGFR